MFSIWDINCWPNSFHKLSIMTVLSVDFTLRSEYLWSIDFHLQLLACERLWSNRIHLQRLAWRFHLSFSRMSISFNETLNVTSRIFVLHSVCSWGFLISLRLKFFAPSSSLVCTEATIRKTRCWSVICLWFTIEIKSYVWFTLEIKNIRRSLLISRNSTNQALT